MLRMCRLNLLGISKFSDFCGISKLSLSLYQVLIVIEPKIKKDLGKIFLYSFQLVSRCILDPGSYLPECFVIKFLLLHLCDT